ncbi:MAG: M48 family metallopeptidase [Chromatiales bacterium]|nr:M48 family metallopeptidase [Chromatiales bacterium]
MSAAIDVKPPVHDCVAWGRATIDYDITYRARKTLAISVHPDLRVSVTAPLGVDPEAIRAEVRKRAVWIRDQWRELELYLPKQPPRRYINGETHRYLGRQYRLRALQGHENSVKCLRGYFPSRPARNQPPSWSENGLRHGFGSVPKWFSRSGSPSVWHALSARELHARP